MSQTKFTKLKTRKNLIIAIFSLIAVVGLGGYFAYTYDVSKIQEATMKYWETGDSRRGGYVIQNSIKENRPRQFVLTKYDLINPVTTVVQLNQKLTGGKQDVIWETFYLKRTGLFEFTVQESIISYSTSYTYESAIELAKKYDVYKQNPDKTNIINDPGLNLPADKLQKVLAEQAKEKDSEQKTTAFNALTKEERIKICQDNLTKIKAEYEAALKDKANGSTKFTDSDFAQNEKIINSIKCES
jgi:hypothetical protein